MSNTTIIELSQTGQNVIPGPNNGEYTVILDNPLTLNKNDVIQLKSAFVDSEAAASNKVSIPPTVPGANTTDLTFSIGYYAVDLDGVNDTIEGTPSKTYTDYGGLTPTHPTGKTYILNTPHSGAPAGSALKLTGFKVPFKGGDPGDVPPNEKNVYCFQARFFPNGPPNKDGSNQVDIFFIFDPTKPELHNFIDSDGLMEFTNTTLEQMEAQGVLIQDQDQSEKFGTHFRFPVSLNYSAVTVGELFQAVKGDMTIGFALNPTSMTVENYGGGEALSRAYRRDVKITIPSGPYDPHDLAELITDEMTKIDLGGPLPADLFTISTNPILTTIRTLRNNGDFNDAVAPQFFAADASGRFSYTTTKAGNDTDYFCGSSQFGLVYDDITDKFQIASIHSSIYSTNPADQLTAPIVKVISDNAGGKVALNKSGGIFFYALNPPELFFGEDSVFKFNPNVCAVPQTKIGILPGSPNENFDIVNLKDGVSSTGDLQGLDTLIQKKPIAAANPDPVKGFDVVPGLPFQTAISQTKPINALTNMSSSREAYFKLEIDIPGVSQNVVQNNTEKITGQPFGLRGLNRNIQAIIGRYYSANNFTTAYNEGSIPFQYTANNPAQVSQFKVRILGPNGELAEGLGEKNTLFIEHVKDSEN